MPAKVARCTCKHVSQDELHGEGFRVFCQTTQSDRKVWRCSVCRNEKNFGEPEDKKRKK